jgi:hypothetical protein
MVVALAVVAPVVEEMVAVAAAMVKTTGP